jgi:simple sugar transport system permease protein
MSLIYAFLTTTLKANQNVTGLALTTFGVGFGNFFGGSLIKITGSAVPSITLTVTSSFYSKTLPFASNLGWFGEVFLRYSFLAYFAVICAIVVSVVLNKTRIGLSLRAVGENPATADAAGINVNKNKYAATCIGSMIAGLGGLYYVMDYATGIWSNDAFGDRGWLAIALVIFTVWRPNLSIFGSILFGGLYIVHNYLNDIVPNMTMSKQEIIKIAPYLVTIIVLIAISTRKKRETQPPASLGLSYFREER